MFLPMCHVAPLFFTVQTSSIQHPRDTQFDKQELVRPLISAPSSCISSPWTKYGAVTVRPSSAIAMRPRSANWSVLNRSILVRCDAKTKELTSSCFSLVEFRLLLLLNLEACCLSYGDFTTCLREERTST